MKNRLLFALLLIAMTRTAAFSQPQPALPVPVPPAYRQAETPALTKFNLDFPGGTPRQLITAIEKVMGKPVNAIIPAEHADVKLPPIKMTNVNVSELFKALLSASQKSEAYSTGSMGNYQIGNFAWGFRTDGAISDEAIWYFIAQKPTLPPSFSPTKVCRFYPLASYLDRGMTVDDITTAIQTGWKMLGDKETPAISFHKETKLLIAVGEPAKLETIDAVLKALTPTSEDAYADRVKALIQKAAAGNTPPAPGKPAEKPKTEN
ncbi:MAG: hypothetical protein U1F65_04805 [Verrucomicrobiota bacterium]